MATEYGVQTNNIFDLLNERPSATLPKKKEKAAAPAKAKGPGGAKGKAAAPAKAQQPKRANNAPRTGGSQAFTSSPVNDRPFGERGRGGNKGFGEKKRFDKERRFDENRPQRGRVFDRHSGTGRSPVENKKGGSGKGNWDSPVESQLAVLQEGNEQPTETTEPTAEPKAEGAEGEVKVDANKEGEEGEEAEEQTLTLEEYQELQKQKRAKVKLPKARKAGEGVQPDDKWAEATALTKKGQDAEENIVPIANKKPASKPKKKQAAKGKKEPTTNASDLLGFTTPEIRRGGGGRGRGKGGPRGRGGPRGGGAGGRGGRKFEQSAPHFDDQRSFPALGKAE